MDCFMKICWQKVQILISSLIWVYAVCRAISVQCHGIAVVAEQLIEIKKFWNLSKADWTYNWCHVKRYLLACMNREDSNQAAHTHSLISLAFCILTLHIQSINPEDIKIIKMMMLISLCGCADWLNILLMNMAQGTLSFAIEKRNIYWKFHHDTLSLTLAV